MQLISKEERITIYKAFTELVNMSVAELEAWLETDTSQSVGIVAGTTRLKKTLEEPRESIGHASGRRIVLLLSTSQQDFDDDDYRHMKKVNGYIKRHSAQIPTKSMIETSRWRYSLMNWGHDPFKKWKEPTPGKA